MAKGANGTIDLESFEQVNQQRIAIRAQNTRNNVKENLGVAEEIINEAFPGSPLLLSVRSDTSADRGTLFGGTGGDIYSAYANVVDPVSPIEGGFGFLSTDSTDLNYRDGNPFIQVIDNTPDDTDDDDFSRKTNYNQLITGAAGDALGSSKHYKGFPDLLPPDIHNPIADITTVNQGEFARSPSTSNFGTSVTQDREKLNEVYPAADNRGTFDYDTFSPDTSDPGDTSNEVDNLGKYFRKTYTS